MRKLLLGSTAVAAAALFAPQGALAQGADPFLPPGPPMVSHRALEVRVGGYFRFNYNFTEQGQNSANKDSGVGVPVAGVATTPNTSARLGKSDFASDAEIHVVANGKATNGLRYGVAIELEVDYNDGTYSPYSGSRVRSPKTGLDTDEMWMYVAGGFGQVRFGDEDNAWNLMSVGHVANFGTGGADGDWFDSVTATHRAATTFTSDSGDNTKVIYLSPQFYGFDVGASFAFNTGEGEDTGCILSTVTSDCDRANAFSGGSPKRRNEVFGIARWRGSFGGVGLQAAIGGMTADATKGQQVINSGIASSVTSAKPMWMGYGGLQATAYGFTLGGEYYWGQANNTYAPLVRGTVDTRNMGQVFAGASYTWGPVTVGANYYDLQSAGAQGIAAGRRELVWSVGATYVVAPGLTIVTDYSDIYRKEAGYNFISGTAGSANNKVTSKVFILGTRIAF